MVSTDSAPLPESFEPGSMKSDGSGIDMSTTRNVKWAARLGTQVYGNPTVSGGKVFVGTNNDARRDNARRGDRGVLMCFDEKTGEFLWQLVTPKYRMYGNWGGDYEGLGICSSPAVEGNRVYVVTNIGEVLCLDANGLADGNHGPFVTEADYYALAVRPKTGFVRA